MDGVNILIDNVADHIRQYFSTYNPSCPLVLQQMVTKCLEIRSEDRWKEEKLAGTFMYFGTILKQLKEIYKTLFGKDYKFFDPDMKVNEDLKFIYRARSLQHLGHSESQARQFFNKALNLEPADFAGWSNRSKFLLDMNKPEDALAAAIKAIDLNKNYVLSRYNKANALDELQRYEEAIDVYDEAIRIDPTYGLSFYYKAKTLTKLKRYDEAIDALTKAIAVDASMT